MNPALEKKIRQAQDAFLDRLKQVEASGGLTRERYARYLSMQYHLTRGVIRHFYLCAAHPEMTGRRGLRDFLIRFGTQEETHYRLAERDLEQLGEKPTAEPPPPVGEWWSIFNSIVETRPLVRLGATCILENIATPSDALITRLLQNAGYLTAKNTTFVTVHRHGPNLPHGAQILEALDEARLTEPLWHDVLEGADLGSRLFLAMTDWALEPA